MRRIIVLLKDIYYRIYWYLYHRSKISPLAYFTTNCIFGNMTIVERMCVLHNVAVGDFSYVGNDTHIINASIGKFCSISGSVLIGIGRHPLNRISTSPVFYSNKNALHTKWVDSNSSFDESLPIVIGNDVWIGTRAIIRDGISIGNGAVIGAGAIITKDVEPYSIMAGVPARCIRKRFGPETVGKLEDICWWDWPLEGIRKHVNFFDSEETFFGHITETLKAREKQE